MPFGEGGVHPVAEAGIIARSKAEALRIPPGLNCNVDETLDAESDASEG